MQLSKNFTLLEMSCNCGCKGEEDPKILLELKHTAAMLEVVREVCGNHPVKVNSGYRCPNHNKDEGGVANSPHTLGKAADIVIKDVSAKVVQSICSKIKEVGGLGHYSNRTHVDTRQRIAGHQTTWAG